MKIYHHAGASIIQGKVDELSKITAWVEAAKKYEPSLMIIADESDEFESSLTVAGFKLTQAERQEAFQLSKKDLKNIPL